MKKRLLATTIAAAFVAGCGSTSSVPALDTSVETVSGTNEGTSTASGPAADETGGSNADDSAAEVAGGITGGDGTSGNGAENNTEVTIAEETSAEEPAAEETDTQDSDAEGGTTPDDGDTDTSNSQDNEITGSDGATPPVGLLSTAQPTFVWPAVANAEQYKIVVSDAGGSGYARALDPMAANCQTGTGTCSAMTNLAYHDNDLSWHVESTVNGAPGPTSQSYSITTPLSENLQPIKSNVGGCEGWASVAYGKYVVLNNSWNSRSINDPNWFQLINVTENANGTITPAWAYDWRGQFDGDEIAVKAYPEVLYGPKLGTHVSGTKEETGLPEKVRDLPEFVVSYDYSETGNAERNVALESFFHDSDDIRGPCDEVDNRVYEMMIWVNNPSIRTPGKLALTGVMVDNQLWNVYIKPDSNKHYIAFTAQNPTTSGTLNWKRFVEWTRDWTAANAEERRINVLEPDYYMGAIEIGTEMWWGEGTFTLNKFEVTF